CGRKLFEIGENLQTTLKIQAQHQTAIACNRNWIKVKLSTQYGHGIYYWSPVDTSSEACRCPAGSPKRPTAPSSSLIDCLCQVESNCNRAIGCWWDRGSDSCGPFQIKLAYWQDACEYAGRKLGGDWKNCTTGPNNMACSVEAVKNYLARYGQYCVGKGKVPTDEDYARIHNGGPNGCKKASTLAYWKRVQACMPRSSQWYLWIYFCYNMHGKINRECSY
uniref:lysozyme n=2 Tax=Macrostomum lignano TaxID=282301 RepID=A0A1I8G525_9PLAT